jgi:hypothetical protein
VVVMTTLNDWITYILAYYLQVLTTTDGWIRRLCGPNWLPIPCLLIYFELHEFLVLIVMDDPLMFLSHSVIPHVWQYLF